MSSFLLLITAIQTIEMHHFQKCCWLILLLTGSCQEDTPPSNSFVKEEYTYTSVMIGSQEWMVENLKNNTYCNGDPIPQVREPTYWSNLNTAAWSYYDNDKSNNERYGKLYNWYAVADNRNICPCGWHVPTNDEWAILIAYLGGEDVAGGKLKSTGTLQDGTGLWYEPNTEADNSSGFTGIPSAGRGPEGGFGGLSTNGWWWTSSAYDPHGANVDAWFRGLVHNHQSVFTNALSKNSGYAVRCIKD